MMLLFFLLQTVSAIPPDSNGWMVWIVRVGLPLGGAAIAAWRMAIRPINDRIKLIDDPVTGTVVTGLNGVGGRIDTLDKHAHECDTRTVDMRRELDATISELGHVREELGASRQVIKELTDLTRSSAQQTHTMLANVSVENARLDERLKGMGDFKDVLRELLQMRPQ